jgi:hypothetical protein
VQSRVNYRLLTCSTLLACLHSWPSSYAQEAVSDPQPAEIVASAGSYALEWRHHYQRQIGLVGTGVADDSGNLWLITHAGPGRPEESLTRIDPDGQLRANYMPTLPLKPIEWIAYLTPATSGRRVALLASIASGGREQTFEGAFFAPVEENGFGAPVRVAVRGPQFPAMVGAGRDEFIAAGDQEPLTLMKLDASGKVLWRRALSSSLVLPVVSVGRSGSAFVLSQGGAYILIEMLDSSGHVVRSKRIRAKQGTVVADLHGGCSLLFSRQDQGKNNAVYLLTLDNELRLLSQTLTPLVGWGGRTYKLVSTPHGHLVVGEGPEQNPQRTPPKKILAEFNEAGALIWQQSLTSLATPILAPFGSGFYLVRETFEGKGIDIEKYAY